MLSAKPMLDIPTGKQSFFHWAGGWTRLWGFAAFLVAAVGVIFFKVASGQESFFFRDFGIFGYPLAQYHRESFWRGEIPLWNPLNSCGLPFLAQWNTLTLYPLSLIYLLLPLPYGVNVYCLAHLVIAGLGMWRLARRWTDSPLAAAVAGTGYCFSGLLLNSLMWPNNLAALAWLPWVLHSAEQAWRDGRRSLAAAAGFGALQMLAGAPEIILLTWLLVFFLWVSELRVREPGWAGRFARQSIRLSGLALLVAGIAAAQLAPFLDLLRHSNRGENFESNVWPMPVWGWANLLVPLFHCYRSPLGVYFQPGQEWTSSYYSGAAILGLAVGAVFWVRERKAKVLALAAAFGLVMALGNAGGVFQWVSRALPFLSIMRFPIKFVVLATVCLPLLAAMAVAHWERTGRIATETDPGETRCARSLMLVGGIVLAAIGGVIVFAWLRPAFRVEKHTVLINGLVRAAFLAVIFILTMAMAGKWRRSAGATPWESPGWKLSRSVTLVLLVLLDLITHAPSQNPTVAPKALLAGAWAEAGQPAPKRDEGRAFLTRRTHDLLYGSMLANPEQDYMGRRLGLFGNCNLLDGLATPDGFYSLYLPAQRAVWKQLFYSPTNQFPEALADFLAVRSVPATTGFLEWRSRPSALPLITGGQLPVFVQPSEQQRVLDGLVSGTFDPSQTVYLTAAADPAAKHITRSTVEIRCAQFAPHRLSFTSQAAAPAIAVIAQSYYHCWHATVDGQPVPIWQANRAFQAIPVPQGTHQVLLEYKDRAFQWGLCISAVSLAWLAGLAFRGETRLGKQSRHGTVPGP